MYEKHWVIPSKQVVGIWRRFVKNITGGQAQMKSLPDSLTFCGIVFGLTAAKLQALAYRLDKLSQNKRDGSLKIGKIIVPISKHKQPNGISV